MEILIYQEIIDRLEKNAEDISHSMNYYICHECNKPLSEENILISFTTDEHPRIPCYICRACLEKALAITCIS
jgi:hypothetical protein